MDDDWGHPHGHGKPHFPNISQCTEPMKHEAWNHQHENRHLSPFHHHFPASETAQHPSTLMPSSPHHPGTTSGAASLCHISWLNPISLAYVIRSASFRCHFSISSFTGKPRWHSKSVCGHFNIKSPSCHHLRHLRHHLSTMDSPFDSPRKKKKQKKTIHHSIHHRFTSIHIDAPFDSPCDSPLHPAESPCSTNDASNMSSFLQHLCTGGWDIRWLEHHAVSSCNGCNAGSQGQVEGEVPSAQDENHLRLWDHDVFLIKPRSSVSSVSTHGQGGSMSWKPRHLEWRKTVEEIVRCNPAGMKYP